MSPRTGRPKSDNRKDTMLRVRMDKETVDKLDYLAEKQGSDRSKVIRRGIEIQYDQQTK